jgi:predicted RNA-binding protein with RPS1 domain
LQEIEKYAETLEVKLQEIENNQGKTMEERVKENEILEVNNEIFVEIMEIDEELVDNDTIRKGRKWKNESQETRSNKKRNIGRKGKLDQLVEELKKPIEIEWEEIELGELKEEETIWRNRKNKKG